MSILRVTDIFINDYQDLSIMKKQLYILLIALCATLLAAPQALAQNAIFQKYSDMDNDDVEFICITKSMLKMLSNKYTKKKVTGFPVKLAPRSLMLLIAE